MAKSAKGSAKKAFQAAVTKAGMSTAYGSGTRSLAPVKVKPVKRYGKRGK